MKFDITTHSNPRNLKVFCCYLNSYCSGPCGTSIVKNLGSPLFSGVCDLAVKRCCSWLMPGAVMVGEWMCVGFWFSFYMHIGWEEEKSELSVVWEQKTCVFIMHLHSSSLTLFEFVMGDLVLNQYIQGWTCSPGPSMMMMGFRRLAYFSNSVIFFFEF